ncbi:MAG: lipoate--protein ligase [Lentisphaeria bacterium]|nr:lipoate--protein ligase [Lentisphaeria bacterium]
MQLYFLPTTDPTLNLACEELLARNASDPVFMLWRNAPSIIIGYNQNTAAEIDEDFVKAKGIRVVRRMTGGGAVYHDLGNINYSCIVQERVWNADSATGFTAPIVAALQALGVDAAFSGRNDILANGRKISGCARSVPKGHTLFHGTLLFDTELDVLASALKPDPEKIRSKGIKSVRARVGNIRDMLPCGREAMEMDQFIEHLKTQVGKYYGGQVMTDIPDDLRRQAEELAEKKYRTWEWNYGTAIQYDVKKRIHFAGGMIQAEFNVKENKLSEIRFSGDFFGSHTVEELVSQLLGQPPRQEFLKGRLETIPLNDYIAGITAEELSALLSV